MFARARTKRKRCTRWDWCFSISGGLLPFKSISVTRWHFNPPIPETEFLHNRAFKDNTILSNLMAKMRCELTPSTLRCMHEESKIPATLLTKIRTQPNDQSSKRTCYIIDAAIYLILNTTSDKEARIGRKLDVGSNHRCTLYAITATRTSRDSY